MHDHIKENPIQHLGMACDIVIDHERILEQNEHTLEKHTEKLVTLEKQVDALEKLYGCQLVWKIEKWEDKMQVGSSGVTSLSLVVSSGTKQRSNHTPFIVTLLKLPLSLVRIMHPQTPGQCALLHIEAMQSGP